MKLKNLMGAFLALSFAAFAPQAAQAEVAQGVIYSIDLVSDYGGVVPSSDYPNLRVNDSAVIRVRLANANWSDPMRVTSPRPWFVSPRYPGMEKFYPLQLGLMLGGQMVYADFIETKEPASPASTYTDFYFGFTVKAGDLALPAYLMDISEKPAGESGTPEYKLVHADMWKITNTAGADVTGEGLFHYTTQGAGMPGVPGEPQNYSVSGRGMGLYVQTVDLDKNYAEPSETEGGKDIWRKIYQGMTTTTTILPSVAVDGLSEENVTLYVWCEDTSVAAPLKSDGALTVKDEIGGATITRSVLPVLVPRNAPGVSFKLQGVALGETKVRMSSSLNLVADDMGVLVTNWVERIIEVVEPPAPFVAFNLIDKSGNPLLAPVTCPTGEGYKDYVAALTITLSKAPTAAVTVGLNPTINGDVVDLFDEKLFGISTTTDGTPWVNDVKEVTFQAGETAKTLYIYSLGVIKDLSSYGVKFTPSTDGPGKGMFDGDDHSHTANLIVKYAKPEIVSPTPADAIEDAMAGQTYKLTVMLGDSFRDMRHDDGYEFWYRISIGGTTGKWIGPSDLDNPTEPFYPDPDSGIGEVDVVFEDEGEGTLEIYFANADKQDTRVKGQGVKIPVTVSAPKKAWAELDRPGGYYAEGETARVKFFLSQKTPGSKTYYAFLVPVEGSVDSTNKFSSTGFSTSVPATGGCPISPSSTDSGDGVTEITCLDGAATGQYDVFICSTLTYSKTKNAGYSLGRLVINATNVAPRVVSAEIVDTAEVKRSGTAVSEPVALGIPKAFRVNIGDTEPSEKFDLDGVLEEGAEVGGAGDNRFRTQWKFGNESWKDVWGNPNLETSVTNYTFKAPGEYVIKARVQDKDMRRNGNKWSDEFEFTVTVDSRPTITIAPVWEGKKTYAENETGEESSSFKIGLSAAPKFDDPDKTLVITVRAEPIEPDGDTGICEPSETRFEFYGGDRTPREFYLYELDGTIASARRGFRITATANGMKDDEGKEWADARIDVKVDNVVPEIKLPAEQPLDAENKPIPTDTVSGERIQLGWLIDDVDADTNGLTVTWWTSEGQKKVYRQGDPALSTEEITYLWDVMSGTHTFWFNSSGEDLTVSVQAEDKDRGLSLTRTLHYRIKAQKQLKLRPHGPALTLGTSGGFSQHYGAAAGLGAGRVYAGDNGPKSVSAFEQVYFFGENDTSVNAYGFGYKADGRADDGNLGGRDQKIDPNGDYNDLTPPSTYYNYSAQHKYGLRGYDSFLYGWACNNTESSSSQSQNPGGGTTTTTPSFLLNIGERGETVLPLPAKETKNSGGTTTVTDSYPIQNWEAVFSREWLKADNCGDINQDGIPDWAVYTFGMGVVDTSTYKLITSESQSGSGDGALPEGDLTDLKDWNKDVDKDGAEDPDYLPSTETSIYASFIPGLKESWVANGVEFGAKLEIRGYHDGLNDALEQLGATDIQPDSIYAVTNGAGEWVWGDSCTISELEFMAWSEFAAANGYDVNVWTNADGTLRWSPERPTKPTKSDTDGDGFTDGYEYYFWYKAHVGYIDAEGVHRYLTGRRYDERNPGEGKFISSEEIARLMDPLVASGDASSAQTRDTDNDGLPDLLEFEIGTNPFDFDTDGDGLPDGWEIMIGGTDPLLPGSSADALADGERNYDGDAMAISSYALEKTQKPVPFDIEHAKFTTFAVIKDDGDTDGVQWYAVKGAPEDVLLTTATNGAAGWSFKLDVKGDDRDYVWYGEKLPVTADGKRLAVTLEKGRGASGTYVSTKPVEVVTNGIVQVENPDNPGEMIDQDGLITNKLAGALYPVRLAAGTPIRSVLEKPVDIEVQSLASNIEAKVAFACWIYGKGPKNALYGEVAETAADYGCLALARPLAAAQGAQVVALPADTRDVAFLHYLVYQEFGFDPRTAWCAKDPVHPRWGKTTSDGQASEGVTVLKQGGYAGAPARTREYRTYDEFLVYSFFLNNGCDMAGWTTASDEAPYLGQVWMAFCTNPRGPNEPEWVSDKHYTGWTAMSLNGTNGADTDGDGVPDGWELYVMAGPKNKNGSYVFAPPYAGFAGSLSGAGYPLEKSYFSPFLNFAKKQETNNQIYLGGQANDDGLNEYREFEGTDSTGWYANVQDGNTTPFSTTVVHDGEWTWFNKFFPTNPWNIDTDGDGLSDAAEKAAFAYGTPADDGKLWSIPGGGLNPCSVDTDLDGLPDGWENQFKGKTVYAGDAEPKPFRAKDATGAEVGNPLEGLTDGMDGTVPDAYNVVNGDSSAGSSGSTTWTVIESDGRRWSGHVDRDYDHDGLENWQEYLVGTMRCWRYDDPVSTWTAFDEWVYFDAFGSFDAVRSAEILGIGGDSDEEKAAAFWYETLVNAQGQFYNPHFITGMSPAAQYFSRVTNAWDTAYLDAELSGGKADGAYYYFKDRVGGNKIEDTWSKILPLPDGSRTAPSKYISCSPIDSDTDCDGMDDYYELFHGMNPLLGASGVEAGSGNACDIVFDAWRITSALEAYGSGDTKNYWQRNPWKKPRGTNGMDFEVFPYLNGLWEADPDGDNDRNGVEFLSTREKDIGSHTDPTPLWMTDSSYSNSLTRLHYRIPTRANPVVPFGEGFTYNDVEYKFSQFDGWGPCGLVMGYMPFNLDSYWSVTAEDEPNWMFSFEENEGFDTDHDALGDREERDGLYRTATDPLDADSPHRRQAMYFQGPSKPSALQTMPEVREEYPVATKGWPSDPSFLNFTVECWAKPEDPARDQTVVERAIWTDPSNPGDQEYLRRNFQIALRGGKWMAKYDSGTLTNDEVKAFSREPAEAKWTHLAATFDGSEFRLYVDGVCQNGNTCGVKTIPENGVSAYAFVKGAAEGSTKRPGDYAWDVKYECKAILVGASFKGSSEGGKPEALDVTSALGWDYYRDFFQGYVDEIRIWDGARTSEEIGDDMLKRYTAADAKANRDAFYGQWVNGEDRYAKATTVRVVPELRYHFHFDSVPGAADADSVMKVPTGFQNAGGKPVLSRPLGYAIDWFATVAGGYGTVYGPDCDWVQWIPNTVAHLPRYDGTTLDSFYWSEEYTGKSADDNRFERSAEPVSRWTQMKYNGADRSSLYKTTAMRHHFVYETNNSTNIVSRYRFSGRHLNQMGDDLLPLGGAFVKYAPDLWDGQGPSAQWEHTGDDTSANMLPDWYEEYVRHTYGLEGGIEPDTDVTAFGRLMKVRELYLRDLARGIVLTADGKTSEFDPARAQIADEDANGVPDWWAEFYRIDGESGLADHDNDGLPNYVEYLLSEVFDFEVVFDPTVADSVQPGIPDYFYRVGELYVGEIFTDHDRMYDAWEDQYPVEQLSRLAFDAYGDPDGDGWANISEMLAGTNPMLTRRLGIEDQVLADYPVPMIRTRVKLPDNIPESIPIVVQAFSKSIDGKPDAIWKTGASDSSFAKTKFVGTNPGGVKRFYLSPGSISQGKVEIFFNDENAVTYTYTVIDGNPTLTKSVITGSGWYPVVTDKPRPDDNSLGDLVKYDGEVVGWIDYVTGEIELDFTCAALQDAAYLGETGTAGTGDNAQATETRTVMDLRKALVSFAWSAKLVKQGSLSDLYLSDADEGYVREGKNTFVAWADKDGSGTWQPGEPYGIIRDVDVSWSGMTAELELTDLNPVTPRILLAGSSEGGEKKTETKKKEGEETEGDPDELDPASDRGRTLSSIIARLRQNLEYEYSGRTTTAAYSNALARLAWIDNNSIETASFAAGEFREQRLRVVRWLINGVPAYRAGSNMRTVLDKRIRTDLKTSLTEADFLVGNENVYDLDWNDLSTEVINNGGVRSACGNVTEVSYLVVVGDGPADWTPQSTNNYAVKALNTVIVRKFGKEQVKPVAVSPGVTDSGIVYSANPTFKWTMDCPEVEGYTAFNVQVLDGQTVIYDSGKQLAPPRNAEGQYEWSAPLYVGDKTLKGEVFEDKKAYTWQVAMYNAKFSNAAKYSNTGKFLMQVQTNGYKYGSANVAVRYFGPKLSYSNGDSVIRVRAYTSPDFTGIPVAAGYVADTDSVTNVTVDAANCTVIGIPEGTYYLQAFIDSDGNGVCDPWETQGYLCPRSQKEPIAEYLDPTAITFDSKIGQGDLAIIYLEDMDIDGDGLPDAWEYAQFGSIEAKGVEKLSETLAGEFVATLDLSAAIAKPLKGKAPTAGLEGEIRNKMAKLRSPVGVSAATGIDPADVEVTDGGLEVKSEIDPETLTIVGFAVDAAQNRVLLKVGAETTADINPTVANFLNITVRKGAEVTVKVEHAESPNGPWKIVPDVGGTVTVDKAGADIEVNLDGELPAQGFFRAKVEEK